MAVTFQLHQVTAIAATTGGATYTVTNTITAATGADINVFCYDAITGVFDHYASAADMNLYPTSQAAAQAASLPYYRLATVQRVWTAVADMVADVNDTLSRVQLLANEIAAEQGALVIDRTTTVTGS